jgi:hypothetical protein
MVEKTPGLPRMGERGSPDRQQAKKQSRTGREEETMRNHRRMLLDYKITTL